MAKKKKKKRTANVKHKKGWNQYSHPNALVGEEDIKTIIKPKAKEAPTTNISNHDRMIIIDGVVCTTGRYTRLYEDYDDK